MSNPTETTVQTDRCIAIIETLKNALGELDFILGKVQPETIPTYDESAKMVELLCAFGEMQQEFLSRFRKQ